MRSADRRNGTQNGHRWAVAAAVLAAATTARATMAPDRLRAEYRVDPLGLDAPAPRLSWVLTESDPAARGQRQTAYQVRVASDPAKLDAPDLWDTGRVASDQQNQLAYAGRDLTSGRRCWWQVRAWDKDGRPSDWSRPATWSMGLLGPADWSAQWIASPAARDKAGVTGPPGATAGAPGTDDRMRPPVRFRRAFDVSGPVRRATLTAAAAGVYEVTVNGRPVTDDVLAPGWSQFDVRAFYRTYDVTAAVRAGANAIGATVADGWWGLHHGGRGNLGLRLQLDLELADGSHQTVGTNPTWRASADGPVRMADLYQGETVDARRETPGWDVAGFDDRDWSPAAAWAPPEVHSWRDVTDAVRKAVGPDGELTLQVENDALGGDPSPERHKELRVDYHVDGKPRRRTTAEHKSLHLTGATIDHAEYGADVMAVDLRRATMSAHAGPPVRRTGEIRPAVRTQPRPGTFVYDLGQEITGWARLHAAAPAGTTATLRFAEVLNPDGTVYTTNLRAAACTDRYTFRGDAAGETYEPRFTFHGFRYVELTGLTAPPPPDAITGVVIGSDVPLASDWQCSDPLLNQLQRNIVWGQRGNYVEVPTDCPQRDERRGWAGDAQAFIGTGTYNQDLAAFFTNWLRTYDDVQQPDGAFANYAPEGGGTSPAWGDAGVICPWALYQKYGDTRVLADGYPHMVRWVDYLKANSHDLVRPKEGFGDWLSLKAKTPKDLIATAYFARSTELMAAIAKVLGKADDAAKYDALHGQIAAAFRKQFVQPDGHVTGETQTGYLLALGFGLLDAADRPAAVDHLRQLVHDRQDHLSVGFLGVNLLLPTLADTGDAPLAYTLLENDTYPSWGYPVRQGATTVWERWNGYTRDTGFADASMNSFNHYAYGSCGQWMFDGVAGLGSDAPGFAHVVVRPRVGGGLTFADAAYDSIRGPVSVHWGLAGTRLTVAVVVPPNVTATVVLPAKGDVTEGDGPAERAAGVKVVRGEPATFEVGSGSYLFAAERADDVMPTTTPATRP